MVDLVLNTIYKFRNKLAKEKYGISSGDLGDVLQKEIREAYPVAMSERLID